MDAGVKGTGGQDLCLPKPDAIPVMHTELHVVPGTGGKSYT